MHLFLSHWSQLIVAISNPPKKQDTPRPLNFKPSTLPGFRAPQPRRFAIELNNLLSSNYFDDYVNIVSDETKYDQISTLQSVLKFTNDAIEAAPSNSNSKYKNEVVANSTRSILRNVLRILKEDAATISSLRTTLAAQWKHRVAHVDNLTEQLDANEKEKQTLNQLLRLTIQQKFTATKHLK